MSRRFVVQVIEDKTLVTKYGAHLADHFKTINDYKTAEKLYIECGMYREAIQLHLETGNGGSFNGFFVLFTGVPFIFYTCTGNWEKAHRLLKNNPNLTDLGDQLEMYGKKLETMGRIKEAEKLYLALDKVDLAINMYKNFQRYDEVISEH